MIYTDKVTQVHNSTEFCSRECNFKKFVLDQLLNSFSDQKLYANEVQKEGGETESFPRLMIGYD